MKATEWSQGTPYTREELLWDVAQRGKVTQEVAKRVMEATLSSILQALRDGEKVELRGFGSFTVKRSNAKVRIWRNPKNGKTYKLFNRVRPIVYFKASRTYRDSLRKVKHD